ncbi:unnamed protein product [Sphagnum troendelagicum]
MVQVSGSLGAHVVAFPFPMQGHINPFVFFSKRLAECGIAITFITTTPHLASTRRGLLEDESFKAHGNIEVICFDIPMRFAKLNYQSFVELKRVANNMGDRLTELMKRLMASNATIIDPSSSSCFGPPACIISDMYLSWTQDIANDFKVPRYCLYPSPTPFLSLMYNLPKFDAEGLTPLPSDAKPLEIPNFPPLAYSLMPRSFKVDEDVFPYEFQLYQAKRLREAAGVLVNSVYELEHEIITGLQNSFAGGLEHDQVSKILTIGPLLDESGLRKQPPGEKQEAEEEDNECLQWLTQKLRSSVLYICFGTVFVFPTQQLHELAAGLESSGVHFLWVVRIPTGEDVATFLPDGFLERTKDRGLVYLSWAPQARILGHPAIGGFLTHCGWNSISESMVTGVPMITWPLEGDQMLNSQLCVEILKVAIAVHKKLNEIVGQEEIERVVRLLMEDTTGDVLRNKAKEVSQITQSTFLPGGSSRKNLDRFVKELNSLILINK